MTRPFDLPPFEQALPGVSLVISELVRNFNTGAITTLNGAREWIRGSMTPVEMEELERFAPGWQELAEYDDLTTLSHVIVTLASLPYHREYLEAPLPHQQLVRWALLYHDLAKRSRGKRDHTHAFRSSAMAASSLTRLNPELTPHADAALSAWADDTTSAVCPRDDGQLVQDNHRIPELFQRLDEILPSDCAPSRMIKIILLHHSIDVLTRWPQEQPLSPQEIERRLDPESLTLLRIVMLADCDGWELLNAHTCNEYRREIRAVFDQFPMMPV